MSFFTFFIFAKVWPVHTKVTDTQTDTHGNGKAFSNQQILADLPKSKQIVECDQLPAALFAAVDKSNCSFTYVKVI